MARLDPFSFKAADHASPVVARLARLMQSTGLAAQDLADRFTFEVQEPPLGALNNSFNAMVMYLELLDFWYAHWADLGRERLTRAEVEQIGQENGERVVMALMHMTVAVLSAFEAGAKQVVRERNILSTMPTGRLYLGSVLKQSYEDKLISQADNSFWLFVREFRNATVHNNSVAECTMSLALESGATMNLISNTMTRSSIGDMMSFIESIVAKYIAWCDAALTKALKTSEAH